MCPWGKCPGGTCPGGFCPVTGKVGLWCTQKGSGPEQSITHIGSGCFVHCVFSNTIAKRNWVREAKELLVLVGQKVSLSLFGNIPWEFHL